MWGIMIAMSEILLAIKPEYVAQIFNGAKRFEFRTRIPTKPVSKIFIYCTYPVMAVVGEVEVKSIISLDPETLWKTTHDAGYEPLGRGDDQDNVVLRLNRVAFPHPDEGRTVYDGDRIEIDFTVKNVSSNSSFFNVVVNNDCEDLKVSKEIQRFEIEAKTGLSFSGHYSFEIRPDESEKNLKNTLEILVIAKGQKTPVAKRKIVFYYSTPTVKDKQNDFEFSISHRVFPRIGSRRVDSDESIGDVTYKATNNTNLDLQAELIVSAHNVNDRHNLIERVHVGKILYVRVHGQRRSRKGTQGQ